MPIAWRDAMAIGVPELDADHKRLVSLVNACEKAVAETNPAVGQRIFELVVDYAQTHFKREEVFHLSSGAPDYERHKRLHLAMTSEARDLWREFLAEPDPKRKAACVGRLNEMLNRWMIDHILKEDMKLKGYASRKVQLTQVKPVATCAPEPVLSQPSMVLTVNSEVASRTGEKPQTEDLVYDLPPHLAHLMHRFEFQTPQMPEPKGDFETFEALCEAAIHHRVNKVLVFFQRTNPEVKRKLPPIFLASPAFAARFHEAVSKFIIPTITNSRQIKMMSASVDCTGLDTENFWDLLKTILKDHILSTWTSAWDQLRLVPTTKPDGSRVLQVKDETKLLREMLASTEDEMYDLPKVGNREIDVFTSLLDTSIDWWYTLNKAWEIVEDIYEQEKDPRIFQDKARVGALRDNLLNAFQRFPEQWGDFLILACHRMFPRVSTIFLESFTTNVGRNEAEREVHLPYTIRYLRQVRSFPSIHEQDMAAEEQWQSEMDQLRKYLKGMDDAKRG